MGATGEDVRRRKLGALRGRHLQNIVRAYKLADEFLDLEALSEPALVNLIASGDLPAVRPPHLRRVWIDRADLVRAIADWARWGLTAEKDIADVRPFTGWVPPARVVEAVGSCAVTRSARPCYYLQPDGCR